MEKELKKLRHSTSHVMAQAVMRLYDNVKVGMGPAVKDGFYYDFDFPEDIKISKKDFDKITGEMYKIINKGQEFKKEIVTKKEALKIFSDQPYKIELIKQFSEDPQEDISIYRNGDFVDLCRGPHLNNTSEIKAFKLTEVAGAYWKGSEKNKMLTRIYGTAFKDKKQLKKHLKKLEKARQRDHRKLGKELKLFSIHSQEAGPGLIHWHPRGERVKKIIENFWEKEHFKNNYKLVSTPHIASEELYKISGHLQNYSDMMYSAMDIDGKPYRVKPMNCPGHIMIYNSDVHSYRELPLKYAEMGTVYRYEKSGVLHGLMRVRGFTIDDAHIICSKNNLEEEVLNVINFCFDFLKNFKFEEFSIYLSTKPEDKFVGSDEDWKKAESSLEKALEKLDIDYDIDPGGGAFYGPKIDIKVEDSLGREWQCSTIQFDFNIPERFDMTYDGPEKEERPYMIHRALLGSVERFMGVLIEHYGGRFPLWLAPVQVEILPISNEHIEYCDKLKDKFTAEQIRVKVNKKDENLGKKIWQSRKMQTPYMLIVGDDEIESKKLSVRKLSDGDIGNYSVKEFIDLLKEEVSQKQ
ncbi:MAG: threonine--tRNA ligase [Elusimicrobiota bacterium]